MLSLSLLKKIAHSLKQNIYAIFLISKDKRVSKWVKVLSIIVVGYAISPIDLIPDFIPILGYLDDLILLPLGIFFIIKLIPTDIWEEYKQIASKKIIVSKFWKIISVAFISLIWVLSGAFIFSWFYMK